MRLIKQITNNKFLNIKEVIDPEKGCKGYQFAERKGKDSVAFICYNKNTKKFLLNSEYTPPTDEFLVRAFGGSLDKDKSKIDIVIEEVQEEVGFKVIEKDIICLGNIFVSTQMNQRCFLYLVDVTNLSQGERQPENKTEEMASLKWVDSDEIIKGDDWKAICIYTKGMARQLFTHS